MRNDLWGTISCGVKELAGRITWITQTQDGTRRLLRTVTASIIIAQV